jgi:hypothetical protein
MRLGKEPTVEGTTKFSNIYPRRLPAQVEEVPKWISASPPPHLLLHPSTLSSSRPRPAHTQGATPGAARGEGGDRSWLRCAHDDERATGRVP